MPDYPTAAHQSVHTVRFCRRTVIKMVPLMDILPEGQRRQKEQKRDDAIREAEAEERRLSSVWYPAIHGEQVVDAYYLTPGALKPRWYGFERDVPIPVHDAIPDGDWTVLEFWSDSGCRVRSADVVVENTPPQWLDLWSTARVLAWASTDAPITATLLDPERFFFRRPEEAGFWDQIVSDPLDAFARLVYADWLDDHDDPHAWVFREPMPFAQGYLRLDWTGAAMRLTHSPAFRPWSMWEFASPTGQDRGVVFALCDGSPVPPFVAYLLAVVLLRAEQRLSDADRDRLAELARALWPQIALAGDLLIGPDQEPVCRVIESVETAVLLGEAGHPDLAARLRAVNGGVEIGPTARAERPLRFDGPEPRLGVIDLDRLTGAWSRRALDVMLDEDVRQAADSLAPLSCLSIDIDHMRSFNDRFSQSCGDRVLIVVTRLLMAALPEPALLARRTGDGFAAVLTNTDHAVAMEVAERLRRAVAGWRGPEGPVTVSVGAATLDPAAPTRGQLLRDADALRRAKGRGRNRVCD